MREPPFRLRLTHDPLAKWLHRTNSRRKRPFGAFRAILGASALLLGLFSLHACSTPGSPSPSESPAPTPSPTGASTTVAPRTATPEPVTATASATATPTPPPLPAACLRQAFAEDIQICRAAPSYDIKLTVDAVEARVTGRQHITYPNAEAEALDAIVLRLLPNAPGYGGAITVTHLLLTEQSIVPRAELGGSVLRVPLDPPLEPGRMVNLSMDFAVDVPTSGASGHGLFSYVRRVMALPTVYPIIPVHDHRGWNVETAPVHGDDVFSEVAIYDVEVTAPPELTPIATGACGTPANGTWTCRAAPMRDFTVILGENYERAGREVRGVVVNSYFYDWHAPGGGRALEVAVAALEAFSDFFGPYPYTELDVVETPNYLGGMEYSGLVVVQVLFGRGRLWC